MFIASVQQTFQHSSFKNSFPSLTFMRSGVKLKFCNTKKHIFGKLLLSILTNLSDGLHMPKTVIISISMPKQRSFQTSNRLRINRSMKKLIFEHKQQLMEATITEEIKLVTFSKEEQLTWITEVLRAELAEPYSVFTYYYFLKNWPELTIMAYLGTTLIGCIIGSIDKDNPKKAYIAMLVVLKEYRRHRVGKKLFDDFVDRVRDKVDKIVLETECINKAALSFYLKLGFFKTRKMSNYYLSGNDAFRLKLYLRKKAAEISQDQTAAEVPKAEIPTN